MHSAPVVDPLAYMPQQESVVARSRFPPFSKAGLNAPSAVAQSWGATGAPLPHSIVIIVVIASHEVDEATFVRGLAPFLLLDLVRCLGADDHGLIVLVTLNGQNRLSMKNAMYALRHVRSRAGASRHAIRIAEEFALGDFIDGADLEGYLLLRLASVGLEHHTLLLSFETCLDGNLAFAHPQELRT